jgi:hypothetical protein
MLDHIQFHMRHRERENNNSLHLTENSPVSEPNSSNQLAAQVLAAAPASTSAKAAMLASRWSVSPPSENLLFYPKSPRPAAR